MENKSLSLSALVSNIKKTIDTAFELPIWVLAEISEMSVNYSGHCYLELVEKEENSEQILAKSRATIWANVFRIIASYFETATRIKLTAGLKILVKVKVEFHQFYGFSLNILDIDPSYTVGELALKRALIIEKLNNEGVFQMNKTLSLPLVLQRIAVISSSTAAGYGDFKKQLEENPEQFCFRVELFTATMQGNSASSSIIEAFHLIYERIEYFDAVVLIRGGGSKIDLSCFDDYDLAYFITQFPLPIITGIGHERDESIADLVANVSMKTPTAVADFLIQKSSTFYLRMQEAYEKLKNYLDTYFIEQKQKQENLGKEVFYIVFNQFKMQLYDLDYLEKKLKENIRKSVKTKAEFLENTEKDIGKLVKNKLKYQIEKLDYLESTLALIEPKNILQRGFSLVSFEGKTISNAEQLKSGNIITTKFAEGEITSKVL